MFQNRLSFWHAHSRSFEIVFFQRQRLRLSVFNFLNVLLLNYLLFLNDKFYLWNTLKIFLINLLIRFFNEIFFNNVLFFFLIFHLCNLLFKGQIFLFLRFILTLYDKMTFIDILMSNINSINSIKLIDRHYKSAINQVLINFVFNYEILLVNLHYDLL